MKIAIDIRPATVLEKSGIPNYTENLVKYLSRADQDNEYILYSFFWGGYRHKIENTFVPSNENFAFVSKRIPGTVMNVLWNNLDMPIEFLLGDVDVVHSLENVIPPTRDAGIVTTVYDISAILFPEWHLDTTVAAQRKLLHKVEQQADRIIAISENTRRDMIDNLGISAERIETIYPAAGAEFKPVDDEGVLKSVQGRHMIQEPYILYVGTIEPRKNVGRLIEAFEILKEESNTPHQLVIVGKKGWLCEDVFDQLDSSPYRDEIVYTRYVSRDDLPYLYGGADVFCYPSLYEGFGLPPLEAMACGAPVVASNVSSMPEVVGDAGMLVNPEDTKAIAEALFAITHDRKLKEKMCQESLRRSKIFSWEQTARQTLNVYEEVNNKNSYMPRPLYTKAGFPDVRVAFA